MLYELDLHRMTVDEALFACDKFLRDAQNTGLYQVIIIHGKGTGILRDAVSRYLSRHPMVRSYRYGRKEEGGEGVTVAELRSRNNYK
jgi:DNA mismatch repair protein MutS2